TYDSLRADPRPIIHFGYSQFVPSIIAPGFTDRLRLVAELSILGNGFTYSVPGFAGGQFLLDGGEHFWSVSAQSGTHQVSLQADLSHLPTGQYNYLLSSAVRLFVRNNLTGATNFNVGEILHVNTIDSAFGSGWGLAGLQEIVENPDGSVLLIDGDGSELLFERPAALEGAYQGPPGDFSTFESLADGTYRRTLKDQTVYQFNESGQLASVTDPDGNQTRYLYNELGLLVSIIDPVDLETTFAYEGDRIFRITDPAGRVTQLEYDPNGNLIQIKDPDLSERTFEYDEKRHLTAEIDHRGYREETVYDFAGRATRAVRKDGSIVQIRPVEVEGLYSPEQTINPFQPPLAQNLLETPTASYADAMVMWYLPNLMQMVKRFQLVMEGDPYL
ncbi:MAG: RHS repeat protein, partial [Bacteroidia bacterium]|nr:RHS repeat protein [Bacteroidia bacterium]